jgi:hypothetical protein
MDTSLANRCRCFQELKFRINHREHEGHEANVNLEPPSCSLCPSWFVSEKSLRAFFEGSGLAAQVGERFAGEME